MDPLAGLPLGAALWKNLQDLQKESLRRGLFEALLVMAGLTAPCTILIVLIGAGRPTTELLETLAQVGAALLIAYVLEVSWLVKVSRERPLQERENRLGALLGVGVAAFVAIAVSLGLVARVGHGDWIWIDVLSLGFVLGALLMVGLTVVMQPLLTHEWLTSGDSAKSAD